MKAGYDAIFFTVDDNDIFNKAVGFQGPDGKIIIEVDPEWEKGMWVKIWGNVVQLPVGLTNKRLNFGFFYGGYPHYIEVPRWAKLVRTRDEIDFDIKIGDRIYFPYNVLMDYDRSLVDVNISVDNDGEQVETPIFRVNVDQVYCAVRKGKIIMNASFVLVEPEKETWEDISIKTYYPKDVTGGKKVLRPENEWLLIKPVPENKPLLGRVAHIGKPLKGDECELAVGDRVMFRPHADWLVNIEGHEYFVMRQSHIMMKVDDDTVVTVKKPPAKATV